MASTYTTGFGIEKIGSGEQSGAWGTTTNHNLDILDRIASYKAVALSGSTHTLTVREASPGSGTENLQDGMYRVIKFTGALGANNTVTIAPNTAPAYFIFENATTDSGSSGPYSVILTQGSGANITIQNGKNAIVYCDGAGSGAAVVNALSDLQIATLEVTGAAAIDGALTAAAITATTLTTSGIVSVDDTTTSTSGTTGSIHTDGGLGVAGTAFVAGTATVGGILSVDDTTTSTSGTTGSIHTDGGLGVAGTAFVAGTAKIVGVTTHGGNVVSDTDSTDDLGTTGVRWANLFVDAITATDQVTATGFTGTLDGILGSGTPAAATVTTIDASGVATATTFEPDGDTSAGDNAALGYTSVLGAILTGQGSTNDVTLVNDADATVIGIPTGTTNVTMAGALDLNGGITGLTGINSGQIGGRRNIVYNGEMKVAQRGTSVAWATNGYLALDRYSITNNATAGRLTMKQTADGPPGFANCLELDVTTADTSIAAGEHLVLNQEFEGQDLQQLKKGTSSAEVITISFYVKGNGNATYVCELFDRDNTRLLQNQFSVTSSWNRIELPITADTTGAFDDDNAKSLSLSFWLHAGTDFTGGTYTANTWAGQTNANRAVGISSLYSSTNNYFRITGIQMEIGSTATEFEHSTFGEELALCQRYLQSSWNQGSAIGSSVNNYTNTIQHSWGSSNAGSIAGQAYVLPVTMRATPTLVIYDMALTTGKVTTLGGGASETNNVAINTSNTNMNRFYVRMYNNSVYGIVFAYTLTAEL